MDPFDSNDSDPFWRRIGCLFCLAVTAMGIMVILGLIQLARS
jgi:hypothetical protein